MLILYWTLFLFSIITPSSSQQIIRIPLLFNRLITNVYLNNVLPSPLPDNFTTDCRRTCVDGQLRICVFSFNAEHYQTMGAACGNCSNGVLADCLLPQCVPADGIEKGILTLNRRIPGPLIEVCLGDLVVVNVMNQLHSDSFSIHWHGLLQRGTQYMDGVPFVTQCPIDPMTSFRYTFWADDLGTYFYHSHSGMQKLIGIFGGFIIRAPRSVEMRFYNTDIYDIDSRVMILNDWSHAAAETFMVGLPTRPPGPEPEAILINGRGKVIDPTTELLTTTPYETFYVTRGRTYRFRIIASTSMACPIEIQIENHAMTVIATDGSPVRPVLINTLVMTSGERYDVVINANQPNDMYWIRTRLTGVCLFDRNITQLAVLSYLPGSGDTDNTPTTPSGPYPRGIVLNDPDVACQVNSSYLCVSDLSNPLGAGLSSRVPNERYYFTVSNRQMNTNTFFARNQYTPFWNIRNRDIYLGTVNGISFEFPTSPILGRLNLNGLNLCSVDNMPIECVNQTTCRCTHIITIAANSVVDFVFIDEAPEPEPVVHPIHIHGYKFTIISQEQFLRNTSLDINTVIALENQGRLRRISNPPLKDTIMLHTQGVIVARFYADNPGAWLLHCHVDEHMAFGMGFGISVGGFIPPRPLDFPTCGNFPPM